MYGDVAVNSSEEKAPNRCSERRRDSTQLEEKHIGAVFPVENMEVQKAVDKYDTSQQISHSQTAYEVVGGSAAEGAGLEDDAEHHQVLQHREGTQSESHHCHGQLLAGGQDHETLHVHEVLPTLYRVRLISECAPVAEQVCGIGGEEGDALEDELLVCRYFVREGVAAESRQGLLQREARLEVYIIEGVLIVSVIGAQIL